MLQEKQVVHRKNGKKYKNMNENRYPEFAEIIAAPGRGKSTDLEKIINSKPNEIKLNE